MNDAPSVATDVARNVPLSVGGIFLTYVNEYGGACVTLFGIVFGLMQIYFRWKEHKAIMRKNKEQDDEKRSE